ncbi:ATP-binding protein [Magnetococcus sp. PR-3]|uniref:ATP-binding protein n=1 Tax=Magnetococcus sp. PR-3 TaxID=3120355 RepID=UPI002FCE07BB
MLQLSLPVRYAIYALILMGGGITVIASYGFQQSRSLLEAQTAQMVMNRVSSEIRFLRNYFTQMRQDVDQLVHSPAVQNYVLQPQLEPAQGTVAKQMVAMMRNRPAYAQVRLIENSKEGWERIRVQRNKQGQITSLPAVLMQQKGERTYLKKALKLAKGEHYFSPIELNREHGKIEYPIRPVMRISTPIYAASGKVEAVMVINLDFNRIVSRFKSLDAQVSVRLINPRGDYLYHPEAIRMFTLEQHGKPGLFQDYKDVEWPSFGALKEGDPFIIHLPTQHKVVIGQLIHLDPQRLAPPVIVIGEAVRSIIAIHTDLLAKDLTLAVVLLVLLLTLLTAWMTYRLSAPLRDLTDTARALAKSQEGGLIPHQKRTDEIGTLARAMDLLLRRLNHAHGRTLRVNEHLKDEVDQRTAALQDTVALAEERRILLSEVQSMARIGGCAWFPTQDKLSVTDAFLHLTTSFDSPPYNLQTLLELYEPEDRDRLQHILDIAHRNGLKGDMVAAIQRPGQPKLWLRTLLHPNRQEDETVKINIVIQDITREHRIQEIHAREELVNHWLLRLNEMAHAPGPSLIDLALEGAATLTTSQKAFFIWIHDDRTAISEDRLFDVKAGDLHHQARDYRPDNFPPCQLAIAHQEPVLHQAHERPPAMILPLIEDQQVMALIGVWGRDTAYESSDVQNLQPFVQGVWRVVQRRQDQEAVKHATAEAQRANAVKGRFLANMSHEIRTPMNAIMGFTELSLTQHPPAPHDRHLQAIHTASRTLLGLINDVLDFSKIDADQLTLEKIPFSPHEQLQQIIQMLEPQAKQKGLHFHTLTEGTIAPLLLGDPLRLRQILINLVSNAIKFTNQGKVVLGMHTHGNGSQTHQTLEFEVHDSGIGMDEAQLQRLFQPFVQGDISTTRNFGGSGLGLSISKRLAKLMGGTIHVESQPGQGSNFRCIIPFEITDACLVPEELPLQQSFTIPQWPGLTLLVAEDNLLNQEMVKELLQQAQIEMVTANNGAEAVSYMANEGVKHPVDGILMDMQMPLMDGLEATRQIRPDHPAGHLPIIAMTANGTPADRQQCMRAGMDDCLVKPISISALYMMLRRWLPEPHAEQDPDHIQDAAAQQRWQNWQPNIALVDKVDLHARLGGDLHQLMNRLGRFAQECDLLFAPLTQAQQHRDTPALLQAAHALRGVAQNLSLKQLAQTLQSLETTLKSEGVSGPDISAQWQTLLQCMHDTCAVMPAIEERPPQAPPPMVNLEEEMQRLIQLLEANDLQARDLIKQLTPQLQTQGQGQLATDLAQALGQFDFAKARQLIPGARL